MKKLPIALTASLIILSASPALAKSEQVENQVQTQNAGEDSQLNVQIQEINMEETGQASSQGQSQQEIKSQSLPANAQQKMSVVSQKVKELLTTESQQSGIGREVREIAKLQNQAQEKIQTHTAKMASRSGLLKRLIGPDLKAIDSLRQELTENQLRIESLEELKTEVVNQAEETQIQETVEAIIEQNTALENQINEEEDAPSVFGWLIRLFRKQSKENVETTL